MWFANDSRGTQNILSGHFKADHENKFGPNIYYQHFFFGLQNFGLQTLHDTLNHTTSIVSRSQTLFFLCGGRKEKGLVNLVYHRR